MAYKLAVVVRKDLRLPKGKLAVQAAHATAECVFKSKPEKTSAWRREGQAKVVLKVEGLPELLRIKKAAEAKGLITTLVSDAGRTVLEPGTVTCLGIGPDQDSEIDPLIKDLKLV